MATPTRVTKHDLGNRAVEIAVFSALDNSDTWQTSLSSIEFATLMPATGTRTWALNWSGGLITVTASGALGAARVMAIGLP